MASRNASAIGDAGRVGGVVGIGGEVVEADDGAEFAELAVIADGDDDVAVGDRQHLVGRDVGMGVAHAGRRPARNQIVHVLVGEHRDLRIEQRHVDMLALAGRLGMAERGLDGDDRIEAGENVGEGDADLLRLAVGRAGDRHQPGHALDDEVVAGARCVRPVLAEAGDRAIDEARVDLAQALVVEAVFLEAAELEILDEHVGGSGQLPDGFRALRRREIHRDRTLCRDCRRGNRRPTVLAVLAGDEGRAPCAGIIAAPGSPP